MNDTCFACDNPATTREHVPPACLFLESKDTDGNQNFRRNLITVPACTDHNLSKSRDDMYLLWVLSTNLSANSVARQQVSTKLRRANERRPALGKAILSEVKNVTVIDSQTGAEHDAVEVPLDRDRFQNVLDLIGFGLYQHHFGKRWVGGIHVHPDFIGSTDSSQMLNVDKDRLFLLHAAEEVFAAETRWGENQDVFYYQVHEPKNNHLSLMMRLVFYSGCTATAFFDGRAG